MQAALLLHKGGAEMLHPRERREKDRLALRRVKPVEIGLLDLVGDVLWRADALYQGTGPGLMDEII